MKRLPVRTKRNPPRKKATGFYEVVHDGSLWGVARELAGGLWAIDDEVADAAGLSDKAAIWLASVARREAKEPWLVERAWDSAILNIDDALVENGFPRGVFLPNRDRFPVAKTRARARAYFEAAQDAFEGTYETLREER